MFGWQARRGSVIDRLRSRPRQRLTSCPLSRRQCSCRHRPRQNLPAAHLFAMKRKIRNGTSCLSGVSVTGKFAALRIGKTLRNDRHDLVAKGIQSLASRSLAGNHRSCQRRMERNAHRSSWAADQVFGASNTDRHNLCTALLGYISKPRPCQA